MSAELHEFPRKTASLARLLREIASAANRAGLRGESLQEMEVRLNIESDFDLDSGDFSDSVGSNMLVIDARLFAMDIAIKMLYSKRGRAEQTLELRS